MDAALQEAFSKCGCPPAEQFLPRIVLLPADAESISCLVKIASERKLHICPTGTGSTFPANYAPPDDVIFLLTSRINSVVELRILDALVVLETGLQMAELASRLQGTDLDFPKTLAEYPGTLGGAVLGPNPSGERHAEIRRRLLSVEIVDPKGRTLKFGCDAIKNVAGYDYWSFLVGTGGRFGVLTRLALNLEKMPPLTPIPRPAAVHEPQEDPAQWIFANLCKALDPDGIFVR